MSYAGLAFYLPTYSLHSCISLSVVVRAVALFPFVRINRIYTKNPTVYNTIRYFHKRQEKHNEQHISFHDDVLAMQFTQLWQRSV